MKTSTAFLFVSVLFSPILSTAGAEPIPYKDPTVPYLGAPGRELAFSGETNVPTTGTVVTLTETSKFYSVDKGLFYFLEAKRRPINN
jgi:hypothetical protein